jgi:alpha-amylase
MKTSHLSILLPLVGLLAACVEPPVVADLPLTSNVTDWRDEVIYQALTDRFYDADLSNNYNTNPRDPSSYHGGDWRGLQEKLPYLEELGVTAIWISPAVKNVEADAGFASYHGYWTQDFGRPNLHFGDIVALRELVDAAHARGIKVILDIVTNHVGQAFFYDINKNGQPDEFFIGQGGEIRPIGQDNGGSSLVRVQEWDPDFSADGVQSWTSLGPSGESPLVFVNYPEINRVPPQPAIFSEPQAYNRKGRVTVWENPSVCNCPDYGCAWDDPCLRQQEVLGDFPGGLKDIATDKQAVRDALFEVYATWIDLADFDGFRIDTVKHVELDFWNDFCPRIREHAKRRGKDNFLLFGEVFDGNDSLLGYYTQEESVDSLFYFSQYFTLFRGPLLNGGDRTCEIARLHCRRQGCDADPCGDPGAIPALWSAAPKEGGPTGADGEPLNAQQLVVNFIENHDVGRLLFFMPTDWDTDKRRTVLHQALTLLMTTEGIPSLYYGVEQEFAGGNDPANRENMWRDESYTREVLLDGRYQPAFRAYDSNGDGRDDTAWRPFDTQNPTFKHVKRLNQLRKQSVAIRRGSFQVTWSTQGSGGDDAGIYAFERLHDDQNVLVVSNFSDSTSRTTANNTTMPVSFPPNTTLNDLLSNTSFTTSSNGCTTTPARPS